MKVKIYSRKSADFGQGSRSAGRITSQRVKIVVSPSKFPNFGNQTRKLKSRTRKKLRTQRAGFDKARQKLFVARLLDAIMSGQGPIHDISAKPGPRSRKDDKCL